MKLALCASVAATMMTAHVNAQSCSSNETAKASPATMVVMPASMNARKNIVETAAGAGQFNTLLAAAKAAGLADALASDGPFTVFAPTDAAFAKLPAGTVETLLKPENKDALAGILKFHVVSGVVPARDAVRLSGATTLNGQRIDLMTTAGSLTVDGAKVSNADIFCTNGVIHVIDRVILPSSGSIAQVASEAGSFGTLLAAAQAAGLADALGTGGPFTVFAPTDEAFEKLPAGTVATLLKPENKQTLINVLKYHIVPGRVYASDAAKAGVAKTLGGQSVIIDIANGRMTIDGASIIATDIDASNGVIHVIDRVILPE